MLETELYGPIKMLLEGQGYDVKSEIGDADVVACRGIEEPLIVELKTGFSLTLFHQAIDRQVVTDGVYIAVPRGTGRLFSKSLKINTTLCRRLGLGLITVRIKDGFTEVHVDPAPYQPRQNKLKKARLLREFSKRIGDPNKGGSTRRGIVTAYRQDALKCVKFLDDSGPCKAAEVALQTRVEKARRLMADDHYGWFERVRIGVYTLSPKGQDAAQDYAEEIDKMASIAAGSAG